MQEQTMVMGCYGIGISRTLAAIVEQNHDEDGIIWPMAVAPYHVIVTLINKDDDEQARLGEELYRRFRSAGVEVLLDDRKERPGVKFKDADLLGIPLRITVGKKAAEGVVEYKLRKDKESADMQWEAALESAIRLVRESI